MPLIVEDGTGKAKADSFVSAADHRAYWTDRRNQAVMDASDDDLEADLRQAFDYLMFAYRYPGQPATIAQRGPWPRVSVPSGPGWFPSTAIPTQIVSAQMLLALEVRSGTPLLSKRLPTRVITEETKSVKGISKTIKFATGPVDDVSSLPRFAAVDQILRPLILIGEGASFAVVPFGRRR